MAKHKAEALYITLRFRLNKQSIITRISKKPIEVNNTIIEKSIVFIF